MIKVIELAKGGMDQSLTMKEVRDVTLMHLLPVEQLGMEVKAQFVDWARSASEYGKRDMSWLIELRKLIVDKARIDRFAEVARPASIALSVEQLIDSVAKTQHWPVGPMRPTKGNHFKLGNEVLYMTEFLMQQKVPDHHLGGEVRDVVLSSFEQGLILKHLGMMDDILSPELKERVQEAAMEIRNLLR